MCSTDPSLRGHVCTVAVRIRLLFESALIILNGLLIIYEGLLLTNALFVITGLYTFLEAALTIFEGLFKSCAILIGFAFEVIFLIFLVVLTLLILLIRGLISITDCMYIE